MENICRNCKWSRDWCCGRKKMKGYLSCVFDIETKPPKEIKYDSNCCNFEKK